MHELLTNYSDKIKIQYFNNINYRGVVMIKIIEQFNFVSSNIIDSDDIEYYFNNWNQYLELLHTNNKE